MTYEKYESLDYLTLSTTEFIPPSHDVSGKPKAIRPKIGNYDSALQYEDGLIVQWHTKMRIMKTHITASGDTLKIWRNAGITDKDAILWSQSLKNVTMGRIDMQVTSWRTDDDAHEITPMVAFNMAKQAGMNIDRPVVDTELNVETCYIGSRETRKNLLRVYDKGLEQGGRAGELVRIELERRKNVKNIIKNIINGVSISACIRKYYDFPKDARWLDIMGEDVAIGYRDDLYEAPQAKIDRENNKRFDWLLNSVAPAMAKAAFYSHDGFDDMRFAEFTAKVTSLYNAMIADET